MNDRLRFRAFHKPTKKMFDVYCFTDKRVFENTIDGVGTSPTNPANIEDCVLEQCTGLKDKNGRLIYEGDIILSNMEYGGTHFVIVGDVRGYCYDAVAVEEYEQYLKINKSDLCFRLSATAYHIITDHGPCTVVGNIHENPELLEDK